MSRFAFTRRPGFARTLVLLAFALGAAGCDVVGTGPGGEQLLGTLTLDAAELGAAWRWLPGGTEIVFLTPDGAGIRAVDATTGSARTLVPPQGSTPVRGLQVVEPFVYFLLGSTLHRIDPDGGALEPLPVTIEPGSSWGVSADHGQVVWEEDGALLRAGLPTGSDAFTPVQPIGRARVFASPDGTAALAVAWDVWPTQAVWIAFDTGAETSDLTACALVDGTLVRWEDGAPVIYAVCPDAFTRHVVGGDPETMATIGGGQAGAWSPGLERVSAWRRLCRRWTETRCPDAERELWIARVDGELPTRIGTLILDAVSDLDDTGPAFFSPDGRSVAFVLEAGGAHDGLRVLRLE